MDQYNGSFIESSHRYFEPRSESTPLDGLDLFLTSFGQVETEGPKVSASQKLELIHEAFPTAADAIDDKFIAIADVSAIYSLPQAFATNYAWEMFMDSVIDWSPTIQTDVAVAEKVFEQVQRLLNPVFEDKIITITNLLPGIPKPISESYQSDVFRQYADNMISVLHDRKRIYNLPLQPIVNHHRADLEILRELGKGEYHQVRELLACP